MVGTNGWYKWLVQMVGTNGWYKWLVQMVGTNGWYKWLVQSLVLPNTNLAWWQSGGETPRTQWIHTWWCEDGRV
jgi:hypothetical protein